MTEYRHTGLDNIDEIIRIAFDKGETVERRTAAIVDLGKVCEDNSTLAYRLLHMAGDITELPELRGLVFDQISWFWDARALPVLMQTLQDVSAEVRFWAAFATFTRRQDVLYPHSPLIPLLDKLVASDAVHEGYWHVGREALPALELIYHRQLAPVYADNCWTKLISPMPEYMNFEKIRQQGLSIPEPPVNIDPYWLKYQLQQRFEGIRFDVRRPRLTCYQLDWQISSGSQFMLGALHRDGYSITLSGDGVNRFARWYRLLFPVKVQLYCYEWAGPGMKLKHGMSLAEIKRGPDYKKFYKQSVETKKKN